MGRPISSILLHVKQFGVRIESLYRLEEYACTTLKIKAWIRDMVVYREHDLALKREPQPVGS